VPQRRRRDEAVGRDARCWKHRPMEFGGRIQGDFPHVDAADYSKKD
jgi:hypothetical protein